MSSLPNDFLLDTPPKMQQGPLSSDPCPTKTFIIGIAGGTASGKTSVCEAIIKRLDTQKVATIALDSFYTPLTEDQLNNVANYNFDVPDAFDWQLLEQTLGNLTQGKSVDIPEYDFATHSRVTSEGKTIRGFINVILLEGILVFHKKEIREFLDLMIFVDTDSDVRLARRVMRDTKFRGRTLDSILYQYEKNSQACL